MEEEPIRAFTLAQRFNVDTRDLIEVARKLGIDIKNGVSVIHPPHRDVLEEYIKKAIAQRPPQLGTSTSLPAEIPNAELEEQEQEAVHDEDLDEDDLDDDEDLDEDDDFEDYGDDFDEGDNRGFRIDYTEERADQPDYEPDEDDKDAAWFEAHVGGDDEDDVDSDLEDEDDYEYEEGGGIVTNIPLASPIGNRKYQNGCWNCKRSVDDESLCRCSTGCGWVRCSCNSCLCDMPLERRLERPHTVKIKYISGAVRYCPTCHGVCFVPSERERRKKQTERQNYAPNPAEYTRCETCSGKGYLTA